MLSYPKHEWNMRVSQCIMQVYQCFGFKWFTAFYDNSNTLGNFIGNTFDMLKSIKLVLYNHFLELCKINNLLDTGSIDMNDIYDSLMCISKIIVRRGANGQLFVSGESCTISYKYSISTVTLCTHAIKWHFLYENTTQSEDMSLVH